MLFEDALKAMREGRKVKPFNWPGDKYIYLKDGCIYSSKEILQKEICCEYFFTDWKIYEKPTKEESVKTENLSLFEALKFLKQGRSASRECWREDIYVFLFKKNIADPEFIIKDSKGFFIPWMVQPDDILTHDWYVIDETEESK